MKPQPPSSEYKSDSVALGISLMIGFCFMAPLLDVFAKLASEKIPVGQITTVRFVGQAFIMAIIMLFLQRPIIVPKQYIFYLFARAIFKKRRGTRRSESLEGLLRLDPAHNLR